MKCVSLDDFPASGAAVIRRDPQTDDMKPAYKALNELILDCFKKVRESRGKRKRAAAQEEVMAWAGQVEDKEGADMEERAPSKRGRFEDGHPVVIYILDPEDVWVLANLEAKHKAVFHDAIYESDAGGGLRVLCYGEEDKLTGKQVVQFRAGVVDYVMNLAVRAIANTEAGGGLTNKQLVRRAVRYVKAEINRSVTYAALGLPQTEA
ncbi:hypothetical protein BGX38DRAFT_1279902 [Terfezia claveryi]|nr:hypothetical protein BGX38DRAFT_1279902 [Terfezia claveryi]